jgi:uncharacterized membrane protein
MAAIIDNPFHRTEDDIVVNATGTHLFAASTIAIFAVGALAFLEAHGVSVPLVREFVAVVFLTFVPGLFVLLQFDYHQESFTTTVCYAFGLSIFLVMVVGGIASLLFPLVGVDNPLSLSWLLGTWFVLTGVLAWTSRNALTFRVPEDRFTDRRVLFVLLLPLVSILGSVLLEVSGNNLVLLALLITVAAIPVVAVAFADETWYFPLAIWCIALALLYHGSVPGYYTFTQPLPQVTLEQLRWIPNYGDGLGSLLANGVLFPVYAIATGLPIAIEWNIVNPFLVAFLPVTLYETFRRYVPPREALIAACLFAFAYPFYVLYPGAGRAATPVIFIALLGLAYSDDRLPGLVRQLFLLAFGIGIATTHYGTAYVVMFALMVGAAAFLALQLLVWADVPERLPTRFRPTMRDGGSEVVDRDLDVTFPSVLRPTYIAYYSAFALAWYLYTADSVKFAILPKKMLAAVQGVLYTQATGSAVSSYQQDYAGIAITLGKYLYVVFGLLMAIGIAAAVLRLLFYREESIETGYLAIGIGFFSMFIGSALPSGNAFAVARVMMIIFVFAVPFAVIGARELGGAAKWSLRSAFDRMPLGWTGNLPSRAALSLVLALFLLLNTGVVSETVTNDVAPSNAISQERLLNSDDPDLRLRASACTPCDVQTHLWIGTHIPASETVYADTSMDNQLDYYAGTLAERSSRGFHYSTIVTNQTDIPQGTYLALLAYNQDLGGFTIGYKFDFYRKNMKAFTSGSQLYTNGYGAIYYEKGLPTNETGL